MLSNSVRDLGQNKITHTLKAPEMPYLHNFLYNVQHSDAITQVANRFMRKRGETLTSEP